MCFFSMPSVTPVSVPEPAPTPTEEDKVVTAARDAERRRRAQLGQSATLLSGGLLGSPSTARKMLLGQ